MNNLCVSFISWVTQRWVRILIVLLLISTTLWICALGFSARNIANAAFNSLQFLFLSKELGETDASPIIIWGLIAMQFLLPVVVFFGLINDLFYSRLEPFFAAYRLRFKDSYIVIIGAGQVGSSIAMAFCNRGETVLIIDKKLDNFYRSKVDNHNLNNKKNKHAIWLSADSMDVRLLKAVDLDKALKIFICTNNDNRNLAIFNKINNSLNINTQRPEIHIQLDSDSARDTLKDSVGWLGLTSGLPYDNVSTFDVFELTAREVFNRYTPDKYSPTDESSEVSQAIIVVGAGAIAKSLVKRAGRLGHFSAKGKLKVIWVDPDVELVASSLYAKCPNLNPEVTPYEFNWPNDGGDYKEILPSILIETVPDYIENALRQEKYKNILHQNTPAVVFVCHEDEGKNADQARNICAFYNRNHHLENNNLQRVVVAVQYDQKYGLSHHRSYAEGSLKSKNPYEGLAFKTDEISAIDSIGVMLADDLTDKLASYFNTVVYNKKSVSECAYEWRKLPEFLKESNRDVADHIEIKLRKLIGPNCLMKQESDEDYRKVKESLASNNKIKDLAVIEHKRYCAFMFTSGYSYGDRKEKKLQRLVRVNPTLVSYKSLNGTEKEKDINIAKEISTAIKFANQS